VLRWSSLKRTGGNRADGFGDKTMLRLALVFLVIALLAALFGFTTVAGTAYGAAKILFFVFLVLFLVSALIGWGRPSTTELP
jgi:uncharacterized membrane protein YtjA (UPF0391 family)